MRGLGRKALILACDQLSRVVLSYTCHVSFAYDIRGDGEAQSEAVMSTPLLAKGHDVKQGNAFDRDAV